MYTLEDLQSKTLKELKEIGWQIDVLPAGDRRCRQNWIEVLVGVNPPLLELLEVSRAEVEPVTESIELQATESIELQATESIELQRQELHEVQAQELDELAAFIKDSVTCWSCEGDGSLYDGGAIWDCCHCDGTGLIDLSMLEGDSAESLRFFYGTENPREAFDRLLEPHELQPTEAHEIQRQEPPEPATGDRASEPHESKFGRVVYSKPTQKPIAQLPETYPGVEDIQGQNNAESNGTGTQQIGTDEIAIGAGIHQQRFNTAEPDGDSGGFEVETPRSQTGDRVLARARDGERDKGRAVLDRRNELTATFSDEQPPGRGDGRGRVESEPKLSQSAIELAVENSLDAEGDLNPILTGITFSPRFLALYSPPEAEQIVHKADACGQLSLLDFEIVSESEPPDPDDFDSLDAFREAMDCWDAEHPELSSAQFAEVDLQVDLQCAEVDLQSAAADFSIPVFGVKGDRTNGNEEPPTAGVGARLPKPKPPSFGPMGVIAGDRSSIEKFARRATGSIGRAPPGGDAVPS